MSRCARLTLRLCLLAGVVVPSACSAEEAAPRAELVVVSVWSGLDAAQLRALGAEHDTTPFLTALSERASVRQLSIPMGSGSPALASFLSGLPVLEHGLFSVHESGHERIASGVETLAERARAGGWYTLGAAAHAKLGVAGLGRGFEVWRVPTLEQRQWTASEVVAAIADELAAALAAQERVLLFLEFEDVRGEAWRSSNETDGFFEQRMAPFRGKGGPVDEAYAAEGEEKSLVQRLKRRLYRQGTGPARAALEASINGAPQARHDEALTSKAGVAEGAPASSEWLVLGGALELRTEDLTEVWPLSEQPQQALPAQQLGVHNLTSRDLDLRLDAQMGGVERGGPGADTNTSPASPQTLPGLGEAVLRSSLRGDELRLVLQSPSLSLERLSIGSTPAASSDLCELAARTSASWPAGGEPPALEVRGGGGRREELLIDTEGSFELLLEYFPPSADLLEVLARQGLDVHEHGLRAGCAVVRGEGAATFELPARIPSSRLGVALFFDGRRVPSDRMNYRGQVFSARGRIELGLSAGAWLDARLRGAAPEGSEAWVALELLDAIPAPTDYQLPTRAERALLERLDDE